MHLTLLLVTARAPASVHGGHFRDYCVAPAKLARTVGPVLFLFIQEERIVEQADLLDRFSSQQQDRTAHVLGDGPQSRQADGIEPDAPR